MHPHALVGALLSAYYLYQVAERQADPATFAAHRRTILAFLHFAGKPLDAVTVADLDAYTRRDGLADSTRAQYICHLRAFTAWATAEGHLRADPFVRVRLPKAHPAGARAVALDDIGRLLAYAAPRPRLWVSYWVAYGAGARAAEVAACRREWVDLAAPQPTIQLYGKGRRYRTLPLAPLLADVLRLWLAQPWLGGTGPLVPSERDPGAHVSAAWTSRVMCQGLHDCGISQGAHGLRHAFARLILAECQDVRAVQILLGHQSIVTTERSYVDGVEAWTIAAAGCLPDPRRRAG